MRKIKLLGTIPVLLIVAVVTIKFWKWDFDDGFIVYRYAQNILNGLGWVYNQGENYNASTSPLNTILVTLISYFTGNVTVSAHIVGLASLLVMGISVYYLLLKDAGVWISSTFTAVIIFLMGNNFTWGLESNLLYALLTAFICLVAYGKTSWILLGFAVLARPDAVILAGLYFLRESRKKLPLKGILLFSLVLLPWAIFSLYSFGNVFPATLKQKIWQGASGYWGTGPIFLKGLFNYIKGSTFGHLTGVYWAPVVMVAPLMLVPQGLLYLFRIKNLPVLLFLTYIFAVLAAYSVLNVPNYHWYYSGFLLGAYLAAAYGVLFVTKSVKNSDEILLILQIPLVLINISVCYLVFKNTKTDFFDLRTDIYKQLSAKINSGPRAGGSIAAAEVGVVGYYTASKMVDMVGLTTPYGEFITGKNNDQFFERIKPDIIIMHNPLMPHEQSVYGDPRFTVNYSRQDSVAVQGYPELSYYIRGNQTVLKEQQALFYSNSSNVIKKDDIFEITGEDPWIQYELSEEKEFANPVISFKYDLYLPPASGQNAVMGRIYIADQASAFSEELAAPMLLTQGQGKTAVVALNLMQAAENKQIKIKKVRLDPIQEIQHLTDSKILITEINISTK